MDMAGEQLLPLPQRAVWDALNDPQILMACIPGCESITLVAEHQYAILMTAAVGPVKAKFNGSLTLSDIDAPNSYSLAFNGSGGSAGFGKGGARVVLSPEGTATKLAYTASAQVGGKLAHVGSRLIDGVARKMAEEFFTRFKAALPAASQAVPVIEAAPLAAPPKSAFRLTPGWLLAIVLSAGLLGLFLAT
jgi:carbon monoxide dehydrogenase subunit G